MAVKKPALETENTEIETAAVEVEAPVEPVPVINNTAPAKKPKADDVAFCVYLGPTIHGVIQSGTVFSGNRDAAEAMLEPAIVKYPLIAKLVVTDKTLAEDRVKVKTAGNALNVYYRKLISGKSV